MHSISTGGNFMHRRPAKTPMETTLSDSLQETLAVFDVSGEPLTTPEVAEQMDLGRRTAYARLERLVKADRLHTKKVGASARVWWRSKTTGAPLGSEQFESLVETVEEYAIFTLDPEGRVQSWNNGAERMKGYAAADILGEHVSIFYTGEDDREGLPDENLAIARAEGSVKDDGWRIRADGTRFWAHVTINAIRDEEGDLNGFVKVTRDMTNQREYERLLESQAARLERERDDLESELDEVFERIEDGFYALDEEFRFRYLNDHAKDVLSVDETVLGADFRESVPMTDSFGESLHEALETQEPVIFDDYYEPVDRWFHNAMYPSESGLSVYFREITAEKRREHELQRYETTVETVWDGVTTLDADSRFMMVNQAFCEMTGYNREEILGEHATVVFDEEIHESASELHDRVNAGELDIARLEYDLQTKDGDSIPVEARFGPCAFGDGTVGGTGVIRDVSDRKQREQELARFKRAVEAAGHSIYMTDRSGRITYVNPAFEELTGYRQEEIIGETPSVLDSGKHTDEYFERLWQTITAGERWDEEITNQQKNGALYTAHQTISPVAETEGEIDRFVAIQTDITERKQRERKLQRQREELEVLNDINNVVGEIAEAVVDQSTREEIEEVVCNALAEAEAYEFAWVAAVDPNTDTMKPRASAGTRGYASEVTVTMDPDDPRSGGPGATAVREQETQVVQDVYTDSRFKPWRDVAAKYDFSAVASIPIVHDGTVYGVLGVYADRENAFDDAERKIVSRLGEVVGHAIGAADRKRALMSDELVELEFQIRDVFEALGMSTRTEGAISLNYAIPVGDGEFIVHGTATEDAIETVIALGEVLPQWRDITIRSEGDPINFEVMSVEPPVLTVVSDVGGYFDTFRFEDGDCTMRIHLAPTADTRRVIDAVMEAYQPAEMVRRRQITRPHDDPQRVQRRLVEKLTNKQRFALDAAYHAGYFEWPRDADGSDIAESLGVAVPTFHQHLRKAEKKLLDSLYTAQVENAD